MSKLQERNECINRLVGAAKSTGLIGAAFTTGDDNTESGDLRFVAVALGGEESPEAIMKAYQRFNYLLKNEFQLVAEKAISRDEFCLVKKYDMADGVSVLAKICSGNSVRVENWWRPLFDRMGVMNILDPSGRVDEDDLCDLRPQPEPEPEPQPDPEPEQDPFEDIADEGTGMDPVPEPKEPVVDTLAVEEVPAAVPVVEEPVAQETNADEEYWKFVSDSLRDACDAVADNALIRANEILNLLRRMLIELICVRNGITENFERAIDKLDCPEKDMLQLTFPMRHDQRAFISALGVVSSIFDRLS
ncbi:MAG: hypothetical protein E7554_07555 [Ruminococcaceae bacterium]|nr:hypothetical protein [Oscillospiraceae bacterium]